MNRGTRHGWLACSTFELVALSVWIGGLVAIVGAVIPAVFNSLGMEPGGRLLTRVFDGYNRLTAGAITILTVAGAWRIWQGAQHPEARISRLELILLTVMVAVAAVIALWLGPASVSLQEVAFAAQGEAAKKAAYETFFRTHTLVRGLYLLNLGLGIALLAVKVHTWTDQGKVKE